MTPATPLSLTASLGSKLTAATCPASFGVGSFIPHSLHGVIEPAQETTRAHNLTDNSEERARAFSFIGTLSQHMPRREAEIKEAMRMRRSDHRQVSKLGRELVLLKARAAALATR